MSAKLTGKLASDGRSVEILVCDLGKVAAVDLKGKVYQVYRTAFAFDDTVILSDVDVKLLAEHPETALEVRMGEDMAALEAAGLERSSIDF